MYKCFSTHQSATMVDAITLKDKKRKLVIWKFEIRLMGIDVREKNPPNSWLEEDSNTI